MLALVVASAVFAPLVAPHDPTDGDLSGCLLPPFWGPGGTLVHPLGTDQLGYDVLSRLLYGARASLVIAAAAACVGAAIGTALGMLAGYFRGRVDGLITLAADVQLATPFIVVALVAVAALGASLPVLVIVVGLSGWTFMARACRAQVFSLREREFVEAARAIGVSGWGIMRRHLLPNLASLVLVVVTIDLRGYILAEAALSFLGLGVQPPNPSWGADVEARREYLYTAWWVTVFPALALLVTVLAVSLIGDWLRDVLDPRTGG